MPEISKPVTKLFSELVKHQLKKHLGEGVMDVLAGGATDIVGQTAAEHVSHFVAQGANGEKLLAAFQRADSCFAERCGDRALEQAIASQPLAGLPSLERLAAALPDSLDDDALLSALRSRFAEDWAGRLSEQQRDRAAYVYRDCLDRALVVIRDQMLPALFRKIGRVENLASEILLGQQDLKAHLIGSADPDAIRHYRQWLEQRTANFTVQGLQVSLPVRDAWAKLHVLVSDTRAQDKNRDDQEDASLAAKLAAYREWERLSYRYDTYGAQELTELGHRVVVIGGPGAGKTTLTRRGAHLVSANGDLVLWVRLPDVARRLRDNATFDQAVVQVATSGFGDVDRAVFRTLMKPDCLLADGLDECGPDRCRIAEGLRDWALARPASRVVVTTRPIGYDPALFDDWVHAELLPLGSGAIEEHAGRLIRAVAGDEATARMQIDAFLSEIARNKTTSLAARNPLLLGFLVALSRARIRLGNTRAALYGQILDLWKERPDREHDVELEAAVADRSLNIIGWFVQGAFAYAQGGTRQDVMKGLATHLAEEMGLRPLEARRQAERCLTFWEQQGVLERLAVGIEEGYAFVHATLGEYAAAGFVRELDPAARCAWLVRVRRDPRWRETVLLAAGLGAVSELVELLLSLEPEGDPVTTERYLAAAALAEVEAPPHTLVESVMARIAERLTSPIPMAAFEAAEDATGLAARAPELIAPALAPLVRHRQEWTRLASLRLMLAAGDDAVDLDALERCLDEYPKRKSRKAFSWGDQWRTWNTVVTFGAQTLARKRPNASTAALLERVYRTGHHNSFALESILQASSVLGNLGPAEDLQTQLRFDQVFDRDADRDADRAALEAVERVCGSARLQSARRPKLATLGAVLKAIGCQDLGVQHWWVIRRRDDLPAVEVVLRGAVAALGIDLVELAHDVVWVREELAKSQSKGLLSLVPNVPVQPDWSLAARLDLPVGDLVRGLSHPSQMIAWGAACLLSAGAGGPTSPGRVEELMRTGDDQTLEMIALFAESLWEGGALDRLIQRLQGELSLGCRWLIRRLPTLPNAQSDERTPKVLRRALEDNDSRVATAAAAALLEFDDVTLVPGPDLQRAFALWTDRGVWCDRCGDNVSNERCPKCPRVPDSPRPDLVRLLVRTRSIDLKRMLALLKVPSSGVQDACREQLPVVLTWCPEELPDIVAGIAEGRYSIDVLRAILVLPPSQLDAVSAQLLELHRHPSVQIRLAMVNALPHARWLSREDAVTAARNALSDERPSVRNRALAVSRILTESVDSGRGGYV